MQVCCVLRPLVCGMLSWYTFAQLAMLLHVMASTDNTLHSACGLQLHSCSMYPSRHVGQAHTWQPSKQTHYGTENGAHAGTGANQGGTEPARAGAHTTATWSGLTLHAIHPITLKGQYWCPAASTRIEPLHMARPWRFMPFLPPLFSFTALVMP
jgi:hypothetical protein